MSQTDNYTPEQPNEDDYDWGENAEAENDDPENAGPQIGGAK